MTEVQNPVADPLGGATVSGTSVTIDLLVNPPTIIPEIIRSYVAANQGYFIEEVFNTPGITVSGGAVIYTETFPEDYFLPADQNIAPRAPGAEAARLGSSRHTPKVSRPESYAGSIEVTDEAKRRNQAYAVQRQFQQAANSFADKIQTRGIQTLTGAVASWGREITAVTKGWRKDFTEGLLKADPLKLPMADIAAVFQQFQEDKAGILPDLVLVNPKDAFYANIAYPNGQLKALFAEWNLELRSSPLVTEGTALFVKSGEVGHIMFEKPLDQEFSREGERKTDVYTLETVPVFVADNPAAVLAVTGVNGNGS
jgi:hypothetical protein